MGKKILILGGGVAGASLAYLLENKKYNVDIIEERSIGGMSRTYYYSGHPYEFGPHIWFWDDDQINNIIKKLTNNELYYIKRRLKTYIEKDKNYYRYPIHYEDISIKFKFLSLLISN
jgi:protoporphyrinogen oxidase